MYHYSTYRGACSSLRPWQVRVNNRYMKNPLCFSDLWPRIYQLISKNTNHEFAKNCAKIPLILFEISSLNCEVDSKTNRISIGIIS